ncbi:MAG: hypothetical protein RLZZ246_460 [Planctomycetota bacterium]
MHLDTSAHSVRALRTSLFSLLLLVVLTACSTTRNTKPEAVSARPPVLTSSYILGPVKGNGSPEKEDLASQQNHPARLRRAWILLQTGKPQDAISATAQVLYSNPKPSPSEESFARYIRAASYEKLGQPERGSYDRDRATALALDPELKRRLADLAEPEDEAQPGKPSTSVAMQRRSTWNPVPVIASRLDPMGKPWRITVHHSAMYMRDKSTTAAASAIRNIQYDMIKNRGFGDIGYHFLIDPAGRVWEGRDVKWQGAHARGEHNKGNIGICVLGNFVRGGEGQTPTEAQTRALKSLISSLMQRHAVAVDNVYTHRDFVQTDCPGPLLQNAMDRIAKDLRKESGARVAARE